MKQKYNIRDRVRSALRSIVFFKYPLLIEFIKWKIIDIYRAAKHGKTIHLYSIKMFVGLYGQGKTMGLTWYLNNLRKKYGDKIYIATNYYYKYQDFQINDWHDLTKTYDKPIVFGYDEIQNDFNSRKYKDFPDELLTVLTQNRKGNGKQIVGTAQRFNRVDLIWRELTQEVIECRTFFGRLTRLRAYDIDDYNQKDNTVEVNRKMKISKKWKVSFVQDDHVRNCYDSYQMLESAKSKDYLTKEEKAKRTSINLL